MVFADISGFTALSEKLATRGRIGTEELVETLSRVFGGMLAITARRGGQLLKFGGDALLLLFTGPDHARQAASAAVEMRAALREASQIPTSVGKLKLKISIGAHSGAFHLFLVGDRYRQLVVGGPDTTVAMNSETAADAGQIVVSTEMAALLGPKSTKPRPDGELVVTWRKGTVDTIAPPPSRAHRCRGGTAGHAADHRVVARTWRARPGPPHRHDGVLQVQGDRSTARGRRPRRARRRPARDVEHRPGSVRGRGHRVALRRRRRQRRQVVLQFGCTAHERGRRGPHAAQRRVRSSTPVRRSHSRSASTAAMCSPVSSEPRIRRCSRSWVTRSTPPPASWSPQRPGVIHAHPAVLESARVRYAHRTGGAVHVQGQGVAAGGVPSRRRTRTEGRHRRPRPHVPGP